MSRDRGGDDEDWLARQFDPATADDADDRAEVTPPPAPGFSWGLTPRSAAPAPPAATPPPAPPPAAAGPAVPPPPVVPPEDVSTQAMTAPILSPRPAPGPAAAPATPVVPPPAVPRAAPAGPPPGAAQLPASDATQPMSLDEIAEVQAAAPPPLAEPPRADPTMPKSTVYEPAPDWDPFASRAMPILNAPEPTAPAAPHDPTSAIDALFGDSRFREYEDTPLLPTVAPQLVGSQYARDLQPREHAPLTGTQKTLMGVASALLAVLALVVLYIIGTQWGAASTQAATTGPSSSPTAAAPTPTPGTGPVAAGTHSWTELRGGECIQPFTSPWATSFRVVDCTADHDAQMIYRGTLPEASGAPYPAAGQLQTEITPMCSAPTVLDYAAAKSLTDAVVAVSYPATAADWNKGDRTFFCFITTASGGNLPSDLAMTAPTK